jgi:DNA-binding CsgD family transcriptional regulator/PAS domain-containing protein
MGRVDEQKVYEDLVNLCYDCVLDKGKWIVLIERLMVATGRQQGGLLFNREHSELAQVSEVHLIDGAAVGPYNEYYSSADPGRWYVPRKAVGEWYHDFIDFGPEAIRRSPYYQEFHRDHRLGNISSVKLYESGAAGAYLSLLTNLDAKLPTNSQQELLQRISVHLGNAGRLSERIQRLSLDLAKRDLLLDSYPNPLWLLDGNGHVLYANSAARQYMGQKDCPLYERFGRLYSQCEDARLQRLMHQAAGKHGRRRAGWLRLRMAEALHEILLTPVPAEASFNLFFQRPLVFMAMLGGQPRSALLSELFQLTPAERRLVEMLGQQLSPEACAERLEVSINTVRSQLRSVFRKTGTSRQAELVALITRIGQR